MATEKQWDAVPAVLLTADGSPNGVLQVTDTIGFYYGMLCTLENNTSLQLSVFIKRVLDSTTLWVGTSKGNPDHNVNLSAFTVATASTISAAMQNKSAVPMEARLLATYETDPVNAWRVKNVDPYGNPYTADNPLPVAFDGDITIGVVEVKGTNGNFIEPNPDGSLNEINLAQLVPFEFNEVDLTNSVIAGQTVPTTVIYKQSGLTVATLTITYDGSANLLSVVRS